MNLAQKEVAALDRMNNSNTIFKERNNAVAPVPQASTDTDTPQRAPPVRRMIADDAGVGENQYHLTSGASWVYSGSGSRYRFSNSSMSFFVVALKVP